METLLTISVYLTPISLLVFGSGLLAYLSSKNEKDKKDAINFLIYGGIGLIIGFGTCFGSLMFGGLN